MVTTKNNAPFPVRTPVFDIDGSVPKHWNKLGQAESILFHNLSIMFPDGERFFVEAVREYFDSVEDPASRSAMRAFCGQEAAHDRAHTVYNEWLRQKGYDVDAILKTVNAELGFIRRVLSKRQQLGVTAALEHLTAILAHELLSDAVYLEGSNDVMRAMWRWHAAEETEHKAIAFDVYKAQTPPYAERAGLMALATVEFLRRVVVQQVRLMANDGIATSPRVWSNFARTLLVRPAFLLRLIGPYVTYFKPNFHPNDQDSTELLRGWINDDAPSLRHAVRAAS